MPMNKTTGNMYTDIDYTWNPIGGRCNHSCKYCYMKRIWSMMKNDSVQLKEIYFNDNLGENNRIFVGSSTDMFASNVPHEWIEAVLNHLKEKYLDNEYLFQSKNPARFLMFDFAGLNCTLATTIETNRSTSDISTAPLPRERTKAMTRLKLNFARTQITIEPIMDFDFAEFLTLIIHCYPDVIYIGADSKHSHLHEPNAKKLNEFILELKAAHNKVILKDNLKRILYE